MKKTPLKNESGVALIMVMTALLVLMALWGEFTFESKLSRIKTTNLLDKSQSRLLAESGLELAMIRLKLYKEAYNMWQKNDSAKNSVSIQLLNQLWEIPFVYPIPVLPDMGAQVKAAVGDFQKESILEGEMKISVQNVSNKLNLNMIRLSSLKAVQPPGATPPPPIDENPPPGGNDQDANFSMEQQLVNHLTLRMREKGEQDEAFRDRFGSLDPQQLVANLKFYISDRNPRRINSTPVDMLMDNSEQLFAEAKIAPKFGPLASFSEIYLIPGWDDAIVDLVKNEFDVFPVVMIDLNKMTENLLRLLIPSINPDEIREFFVWRDNPEAPQFFNSVDDFKRYIVDIGNVLSEPAFDELFGKYRAQGIQFGAAPTLFRVLSEGTLNRSTTTLVATVAIPTQAVPPPVAPPPRPPGGSDDENPPPPPPPAGAPGANQSAQLLDPRIIELQVN